MDALTLARWQFGITTVYHFIFVPLTIGLSPLVAILQTAWVRTGNERWLKLTKFFGKLLLINFAIGVATGIVQEFQFGMNWSEYSRFVGDIFGAPLAMEALAAFFIESTFLGLWIFGWDKLPKKVHLATVWLVAFATNLSAYFILAANSWMQHPVGAEMSADGRRAEMVSIGDVLTNPTLLAAFPHVITVSLVTAGTAIAGISVWWMVKSAKEGNTELAKDVWRPGAKFGAWVLIIAGIGTIWTGDWQAKMMFNQQPMKMASAEAMCGSYTDGAPFSILTICNPASNNCSDTTAIISVPGLTSFLAKGSFTAPLAGIDELQQTYTDKYASSLGVEDGFSFVPNLLVTYWSFRLMIGFGVFSAALGLAILWLTRGGAAPSNGWLGKLGLIALPAPLLASSFGWIFTEMGRQPWIVAPNPNPEGVDMVWMLTQHANSPVVGAVSVIISMVAFTLIYLVCAVFWFMLLKKYAAKGVPDHEPDVSPDANADSDADRPMSFAY